MPAEATQSRLNCFQSAVVELFADASLSARFAATSLLFWNQISFVRPFSIAYSTHLATTSGHRGPLTWRETVVNTGESLWLQFAEYGACVVSVDIGRIGYRTDLRAGDTPLARLHSFAVIPQKDESFTLIDRSAAHTHIINMRPDTANAWFAFPLKFHVLTKTELLPRHLELSDLKRAIEPALFDTDSWFETATTRPGSYYNDLTFLMYSRRHFCSAWAEHCDIDLHFLAETVDLQIAAYRRWYFGTPRAQMADTATRVDDIDGNAVTALEGDVAPQLRAAAHSLLATM